MPAHIMVIENDKHVQNLFMSILTHAGWQVFSEGYATINLAVVQQFNPDLIILAFDTPHNGVDWAFLQQLKMDDSTAAIPVLVCAAPNSLPSHIAGYLAGRNIRIIHKPFAAAPFIQIIQEILTTASLVYETAAHNSALLVLVVEDNVDLCEMVTLVLKLEGYLVMTAANGKLALETVAVVQHRLILLDLNMPVMNGFEFLAAYTRQPGPHCPVIICSATSDNINPAALPPFVVGTLPKPYHIGYLRTLVKETIQLAWSLS
ncbi:MAG: response regulator [Chloroflexota bacterium]